MRRSSRVLEEGSRERSGLTLFLPILVVAGLFAALMLAASLQGAPQFSVLEPQNGASPSPLTQPTATFGPEPGRREEPGLVLLVLQAVVVGVIVVTLLSVLFFGIRLLVRTLARLWRERPLGRGTAADLDGAEVEVASDAVAAEEAVIRRGIAEALRVIDDTREPGDAIVRAWVGLEETASDAGIARRATETPGELVVRIVGRRAGIAGDVARLLRLYEGVRFGGERADEERRAEAARCLARIEEGWR